MRLAAYRVRVLSPATASVARSAAWQKRPTSSLVRFFAEARAAGPPSKLNRQQASSMNSAKTVSSSAVVTSHELAQ